jgi:hypothetical protein
MGASVRATSLPNRLILLNEFSKSPWLPSRHSENSVVEMIFATILDYCIHRSQDTRILLWDPKALEPLRQLFFRELLIRNLTTQDFSEDIGQLISHVYVSNYV